MPGNYCRLTNTNYASPDAKIHYRPDMVVYPTHIKFDLIFNIDSERIAGYVEHHLHFIGDLEELVFDAVNLEIFKVVCDGEVVEFENTGKQVIIPFIGKKDSDIVVGITYSVEKPQAGMYFVNPDEDYPDINQQVWSQGQDEDTKFYAPIMDNPAFKHTSEFRARIPRHWTSLSNGELIEDEVVDEKRVMHWKFDIRHSTYLVTFAAGDLFEHSESVKIGDKEIDIRWYAQKGREDEAHNSYKQTADIIKFFSEYTRFDYPYDSYSQWSASRFIFGGMENTTATTQTDLTLRDDRAAIDSTSDNLVAHEAAHQWFGDWITAKSWAHAWLHESFATYFDALYTEHNKGRDEFVYQMRSNKLAYFAEDRDKYRRPLVTKFFEEPIDLFDRHLYPGGSWRVHMLRILLGEDTFRNVLSYYLKKHAQASVETVDLARAIEQVSGKNYDWFFDQWILQAGYPRLKINYSWDKTMAKLTVKQTQKIKDSDNISTKLFRIPTEIQFTVKDKKISFPVTLTEKEHTFYFPLEEKPKMVRFDPRAEVLCSIEFDKPQDLLLTQLKEDDEISGQILAAETLAKKPNLKVIKVLGEQLMNENIFWGVRSVIAKSMGKIHGDVARHILLDALQVEHPKVRRAIVSVLADFTNDSLVYDKLVEKIDKGDNSYYVEGDLLSSLGKLKFKEAFEVIISNMDKDTFNDYAIIEGIKGIVSLDEKRSLDEVLKRSEYGQAELARITAISNIGKLGKHRESRHNECLSALKTYSSDPLFRCRIAAIDGIKQLGLSVGIPVLRKMHDREADGRMKSITTNAIRSIQKGLKKNDELKIIQEDLDKLSKENKKLRDRLDKLEKSTID